MAFNRPWPTHRCWMDLPFRYAKELGLYKHDMELMGIMLGG